MTIFAIVTTSNVHSLSSTDMYSITFLRPGHSIVLYLQVGQGPLHLACCVELFGICHIILGGCSLGRTKRKYEESVGSLAVAVQDICAPANCRAAPNMPGVHWEDRQLGNVFRTPIHELARRRVASCRACFEVSV